MKLFISPHNDDEILFGAYTIMREKPLVVIITHSTMQGNNGDERTLESYRAMKILGVPIVFLGIDEDKITEEILNEKFNILGVNDEYLDVVYIPEYQENGNPHHNLVNEYFKKRYSFLTKEYKTYSGLEDRTIGKEIIPTDEELEIKKRVMACYKTQIENPMTSHYFTTYNEYE